MLFNKIQGHTGVLSLLEKCVARGDTSGTFIFTGPIGVGKSTIAKIFSKYLTCVGTLDDTCRCDNCRSYPATPDILLIVPDGSSIKVEQIREIDDFLSLAPFKAKRRIVLIDDADLMTHSAANAILKISEEPPSNSTIILITSSLNRILPTIQSRAEVIEFGGLTPEEFLRVMESKGHSKSDLERLIPCVRSFSGNAVMNFSTYARALQAAVSFLKGLKKSNEDDMIGTVSDFDTEGTLKEFSEALLIGVGDIYRFKTLGVNSLILGDKWENISGIEGDWTEEGCLVALDKIKQAMESVDNRLNLKLKPRLIVALLYMKSLLKKDT